MAITSHSPAVPSSSIAADRPTGGRSRLNRRSFLQAGIGAAAVSMLSARTAGAAVADPAWNQLTSVFQGEFVFPSSSTYATAKQLFLMQYDNVNPAAIAYCASPSDVSLCLKFAKAAGLPIAVRSGGHSTGGYSTTTGLVVDVSRLKTITPGRGTVTLGPGAQLVDITAALAPSGQAFAGGYGPTVRVGGYLQGGGVGPLTRRVGVASDTLCSAQVVLANGSIVTASATQNADLFWALRGGGGGNFGVVTSYTTTTTAVPTLAVANLAFSYDQAVNMLDGWAQWIATAPRTIGGAATLTLPNAAPGATPIPGILVTSSGTTAELDTEIARLVALTGAPVSRSVNVVPFQTAMMIFYGCSAFTVPQCHLPTGDPAGVLTRAAWGMERSRLFSSMPRTGWEQAVAHMETGRLSGQFHQLRVIAFGGAANDPARIATAYVHRNTEFCALYSAQVATAPADPAAVAVAQDFLDRGFATITPYSNGEAYQNFIDPKLADWKQSYYAENYTRLSRIKAAYDRTGLFRSPQSIG